MHSYWYVSRDKLQGLGAFDPARSSRLHTNAKVGIGLASVGVDVDPALARTVNRAAAKAERQLRREHQINDIAGFTSGRPPAQYFESSGPACRRVIEDMLWVAGIDDGVAVLLVGSASNTVGARRPDVPTRFHSPTSDPEGAVRDLLEHSQAIPADRVSGPGKDALSVARFLLAQIPQRTSSFRSRWGSNAGREPGVNNLKVEDRMRAGTLADAWETLMKPSLELADDDVSALPRARSISLYVARYPMRDPGRGWN